MPIIDLSKQIAEEILANDFYDFVDRKYRNFLADDKWKIVNNIEWKLYHYAEDLIESKLNLDHSFSTVFGNLSETYVLTLHERARGEAITGICDKLYRAPEFADVDLVRGRTHYKIEMTSRSNSKNRDATELAEIKTDSLMNPAVEYRRFIFGIDESKTPHKTWGRHDLSRIAFGVPDALEAWAKSTGCSTLITDCREKYRYSIHQGMLKYFVERGWDTRFSPRDQRCFGIQSYEILDIARQLWDDLPGAVNR